MKRLRRLLAPLALLAIAGAAYYYTSRPPSTLTLTGIVTTNDVIVSPQIAGQIQQLFVTEGDVVKKDQLLAVLRPDELRQDSAFFLHSAEGASSQVRESAAALRFQERQTGDQIQQAEATLAAAESQRTAAEADLENLRMASERLQKMTSQGVAPMDQFDQARMAHDAAKARVAALSKQVDAQRSAVALARSNAEQVSVRRNQLQANEHQQAAANAQRAKADVRLAYTEIHAPLDGIVDVRAVRVGEVVTPGQPVVTIINPDELWVRVDVEETYVDRVRLGDVLSVRLPSGAERQGTVFFRGVDAGFATQRDVSRTKRDIKTFEIRLRMDNRDRALAVGLTAYVLLPVS
jgi:HlyD family secretion protein